MWHYRRSKFLLPSSHQEIPRSVCAMPDHHVAPSRKTRLLMACPHPALDLAAKAPHAFPDQGSSPCWPSPETKQSVQKLEEVFCCRATSTLSYEKHRSEICSSGCFEVGTVPNSEKSQAPFLVIHGGHTLLCLVSIQSNRNRIHICLLRCPTKSFGCSELPIATNNFLIGR